MNINGCIKLHPFIKSRKKLQKVFVFDFDETLGSFGHLYYLWDSIVKTNCVYLTSDDKYNEGAFQLLKKIMDLYPEFLRYGILVILEFLYFKKIQGKCYKIFIYTNNQSTVDWVNLIIRYICSKIPTIKEDIPLFDKIIYAFKIKNKIIEFARTTQKKTYDDFINCSVLSKNTEICFIDDAYHPKMINKKIYYIQPQPYHHNLSKYTILTRLFSQPVSIFDSKEIKSIHKHKTEISMFFNESKINDFFKTDFERKNDIFVSKKLMHLIKDFFYIVHAYTKKKNVKLGKITRKYNHKQHLSHHHHHTLTPTNMNAHTTIPVNLYPSLEEVIIQL